MFGVLYSFLWFIFFLYVLCIVLLLDSYVCSFFFRLVLFFGLSSGNDPGCCFSVFVCHRHCCFTVTNCCVIRLLLLGRSCCFTCSSFLVLPILYVSCLHSRTVMIPDASL